MEFTGIKTAVLIVAGGNGTRMGSSLPKQFLPLAGKPVLVHSIERFRKALPGAVIYLGLGKDMHSLWEQTAGIYGLGEDCRLCEGGSTRFETVKNALAVIEPCDLVLIHDAVRPLVPADVIRNVIRSAGEYGAAVPVIAPTDSFRVTESEGGSRPFDRSVLRAVQTPQGFRYGILSEAYRQPYRETFTDDAQVVENSGHKITICEGSPCNIKLTYPSDMAIAEAIILSAGEEI